MKILVTGGAGFIGSHIVESYLSAGHQVDIADDLSTGKAENISHQASFFKIDISDSAAVESLLSSQKYDIINHHAAQLDVRKSVTDPVFDARVNIIGTLNLLEWGMNNGMKKFIFASSGGTVYGEQETFPANELHSLHPVSPYGVAKLTVENYLFYYGLIRGLKYVALRYANVFGPRQNPHGEAGVVAIFADKILSGQQPVINGDGLQSRDYVFVKDVVNANLLALDYADNCAFNIGTGIETDVLQVFDMISEELGGKFKRKFAPAKEGEQRRSVLDNTFAFEELNWKPEFSLSEGMKITMDWFKQKHL